MIRLITFDLDGVLGREADYASVRFEKRYGIPRDEFYKIIRENNINERICGRNFELFRELLAKYNTEMDEKEFWDFWCADYMVDGAVVDFALSLKRRGLKIAIVSYNPAERAEHLRDEYAWMKEFDYVLFSGEVGCSKESGRIFEELVRKSGVSPENIFFIDDNLKNVEAARKKGIIAKQFTGIEAMSNELKRYGISAQPKKD